MDEKALARAVQRAMENAGTLPAKESVKLVPADWHLICDLVLNPSPVAGHADHIVDANKMVAPDDIPGSGKMVPAPAEMPGVEEIADAIQRYIPTFHGANEAARAILDLFAPILAEKERATVKRIAEVASAVAAQAGVGASETAGLIVSVLAANPEHTERFMSDGSELFIDGTIRPENGCLSHMAMNGHVVSPTKLRMMKGQSQ